VSAGERSTSQRPGMRRRGHSLEPERLAAVSSSALLAPSARLHTHVLADEAELDYARLLAAAARSDVRSPGGAYAHRR
jgi:hypothetical protein